MTWNARQLNTSMHKKMSGKDENDSLDVSAQEKVGIEMKSFKKGRCGTKKGPYKTKASRYSSEEMHLRDEESQGRILRGEPGKPRYEFQI